MINPHVMVSHPHAAAFSNGAAAGFSGEDMLSLYVTGVAAAEGTLGATALQRAGEVRASMNKDRDPFAGGPRSEPVTGKPMATRQQSPRPPATTSQKPETKPSIPTAPSSQGPPVEGGTTSRLLEIKRRREQDGEGKKE